MKFTELKVRKDAPVAVTKEFKAGLGTFGKTLKSSLKKGMKMKVVGGAGVRRLDRYCRE